MVTSTSVPAPGVSALFSVPDPNTNNRASGSTDSFAQQLASVLSGYLHQAGSSTDFEIDIKSTAGQKDGTRQFLVTLKTPTTSASTTLPASSASPVLTGNPPATSSGAPTAAPPVTPDVAPPTKFLANGKPVLNEADAYWASQPPAVQRLRDVRMEGERWDVAHELADQGFLIDVPIMVWGWDPLATMIVRQNSGYTWIPSAKMDPVKVAPGINFPGLPTYDPKNPPEGSIPVTTDWAKGYEKTDPWLYDSQGNARG